MSPAIPLSFRRTVLLAVFGTGLVIRLAILVSTAHLAPAVVDEQHYIALASNVLAGNGFGWGPNDLTSIRPWSAAMPSRTDRAAW